MVELGSCSKHELFIREPLCRLPIAVFMPSLSGGGAERISINLSAAFASRGHQVDLVLASASGEYLNQLPQGIRVIDLCASRPLTALPALARYLVARRPLALLATITSANLAALWATRLTKSVRRCVVREASTLSMELANSSHINRILLPRMIAHTFPNAHAIVTPSAGVADDLSKVTGIPRRSIQVIYNPVVSSAMLSKSREMVKHPWFRRNRVPVILGIGRLTRQKDFATLIRAFALVRETLPAKLIILGEGEQRQMLESLCLSLGIAEEVDMPGFVNNPYAFLSRAVLFVLSSMWEGLPGVLIEALACGTKVVATDCPSGPREILGNNIFGQLVPVGDVQQMARAILRALSADYVGSDPRDHIRLFDMETNINQYLNLLLR